MTRRDVILERLQAKGREGQQGRGFIEWEEFADELDAALGPDPDAIIAELRTAGVPNWMVSSVNGEEAFAIASRGLDHDYTAIGPTLAAALTALAEKVRDA